MRAALQVALLALTSAQRHGRPNTPPLGRRHSTLPPELLRQPRSSIAEIRGAQKRLSHGIIMPADAVAVKLQPGALLRNFGPALATLRRHTRLGLGNLTMVSPMRLAYTAALAHHAASTHGLDTVETGVAGGGTSILVMSVLEEHRTAAAARHWAADSFEGLPRGRSEDLACDPSRRDASGRRGCGFRGMATSRTAQNFGGMFKHSEAAFLRIVRAFMPKAWWLGERPRLVIVRGWFKDTLPPAGLASVGFLRLDGDLYGSTAQAINALWPHLVDGGVIYIDDYGVLAAYSTVCDIVPFGLQARTLMGSHHTASYRAGSFSGCRRAVDEFRATQNITTPMNRRDHHHSSLG